MKTWALVALLLTALPARASAIESLQVRGLLDVTAAGGTRAAALNAFNNGDSNFDPYRLRVFLDSNLDGGFAAHVQAIVIGQNYSLLQYGAYVQWTPLEGRDLNLQAGFIPWAVGTWAPVALGSLRPIEFSAGFVQGAPSWPQNAHDGSPGKTVLGRLGIAPWPAIRAGISAARGPWMPSSFESSMPAGVRVGDLEQRLAIADLELQHGSIETRGEAFFSDWETPFVGRLAVRGAWAEAKVGVAPGAWVAIRGEGRRHGKLSGSGGVRQPWDHDRDSWEGGIGYRATRQAVVKVAWQRNVERIPGDAPRHDDLYAGTVSLSF